MSCTCYPDDGAAGAVVPAAPDCPVHGTDGRPAPAANVWELVERQRYILVGAVADAQTLRALFERYGSSPDQLSALARLIDHLGNLTTEAHRAYEAAP